MENRSQNLPKIFHVNWFRKGDDGRFLWPGFGENSRVLDWILKRLDGEECAVETAIGFIPKEGALNLQGLQENVRWNELFGLSKEFWLEETRAIEKYFNEQVGQDLPAPVAQQLKDLKRRAEAM